ncbi:MAG: hypothetical protein LBT38_05560 [Deltaproteobacteria bacterium]|nr:hypothetical protein [Deltaproteobacteria bacterium]
MKRGGGQGLRPSLGAALLNLGGEREELEADKGSNKVAWGRDWPFISSDPETRETLGAFQGRLSLGSFVKAQSLFQENARREEGRLKKAFRYQLVANYISAARVQAARLSLFLQEVFSPSNFQGHSFLQLSGFLSHMAQNFGAAFRAKIKPNRALFSTNFQNDLKIKIQRANSAESLSFLWRRFVDWWRGNFEGAGWNLLGIFARDPKILPRLADYNV